MRQVTSLKGRFIPVLITYWLIPIIAMAIMWPVTSHALHEENSPILTPVDVDWDASSVSDASVTNNPVRPGAPATYTFRFTTTSAGGALNAGEEIIFRFDKEFFVPSTIDRNQVSLATDDTGYDAPCNVSETVAPTEVRVSLSSSDLRPEVRLQVPDMNPSDNCPDSQGIAELASVTVIFRQAAGIRNPQEGHPGRRVEIGKIRDLDPASVLVQVPWTVELSNSNRSRSQPLTITGYGFRGQTTFWRDANADGVRQATESGPTGVCTTTATSEFVATCTFAVNNPPFAPQIFAPGGNCTYRTAVGCNYINAMDSRGNTVILHLFANPQDQLNAQTLELLGTVTVSPASGQTRDTISVQLWDFPAQQALTQLDIAGIPVTQPAPNSITTDRNGSAAFLMVIPDGVPLGAQEVNVRSMSPMDSSIRRTSITITITEQASLSLSDQTVIPNQDLTISGSGFTQGRNVTLCERDITVAGDIARIHPRSIHGQGTPCASGESFIRVEPGGTFNGTVIVPTTNQTLQAGVSRELRVLDSRGRLATASIDIAQRSLDVTPATGRPRDLVTITGRGFPASNPDSVPMRVLLQYICGADFLSENTANADGLGNFRQTLRIPTSCAIPSANTITAWIGDTGFRETTTHQIPDAIVRTEPIRGSSGSPVRVVGQGFPSFESVAAIEFGGLDVWGGRTANADSNGDFALPDIVVPNIVPGVHTIVVRVGTGANQVTASTSFNVEPPVQHPAEIAISTSQLAFRATVGEGNPSNQSLSIWNSGGGILNWSAMWDRQEAPWLAIEPNSGSSSGQANQMAVRVNTAGLPAETYSARVTIAAPGAANSPQAVLVTLEVVRQPEISLSTNRLEFVGEADGGDPPDQSLSIRNSGGGILNWSATWDRQEAPWLAIESNSGSSSGQANQVAVRVNTTGLPDESYSARVTISAPGAVNSPQTVLVTLEVVRQPEISLSTDRLEFVREADGGDPPDQSLSIWNSGGGDLNWSATWDRQEAPWLAIEPNSGSSSGQANQMAVRVNTAGLPAEAYSARVTVSAPGAANSPQAVMIDVPLDRIIFPGEGSPPTLLPPPPTPTPQPPLLEARVYPHVEVDVAAISATPEESTLVTVSLRDLTGSPQTATEDVQLILETTQGQLTNGLVTVPMGAESATTTLIADFSPAIAIVTASLGGFSSKKSIAFVSMQPPSETPTLNLVIDQLGLPVGQPMQTKVMLLDNHGFPVAADKDYALTFWLDPIEIRAADSPRRGDTPDRTSARRDTTVMSIDNEGSLEWSGGPVTIHGNLLEGDLVFSFHIKFLGPVVARISLDIPGAEPAEEVIVAARPGTPTSLYVIASPDEIRADGNSQSGITVILINQDGDPTCPDSEPAVRNISLASTHGSIIKPESPDLVTINCNTRTDEEIVLTSSNRAGAAKVEAVSTFLGIGVREVLFSLVPPDWSLLLLAGAGGIIGSLLKIVGDRPKRVLSRSQLIPELVVGLSVGTIIYLALYYGIGTTILPVPFYNHQVFALLLGALAGYGGVSVLDKIVDKLGWKKVNFGR